MKIQLGLIVCAAAAFGQVSSITFDGVGDSSVRVIFDVKMSFNAVRVRYGTSSCAGGTNGTVQGNSTQDGYQQFGMTSLLAGLAPSTMYYVCPEVSGNGGSSWSNGAEAAFTTNPRTQILPLPPTPVSTTYPAQTGIARMVASDCSNLQALISAAMLGDTIVVPAGTVCSGAYTTPTAPDAKTFVPADVRTSTSTITLPSHGFTENQEVHFSTARARSSCLPGMTIIPAASALQGFDCDRAGGWNKNAKYYVHVVDTNHVQILTAPNGSPAVPGWIHATVIAGANAIAFNPTWATPNGYAYLQQSTPIRANIPVQFISTGTLPGGLYADTTYYLRSGCAISPNAACITQLAATSGGPAIPLTSGGTGTLTIVDQGLGTLYIAPAPKQTDPWIVITTGGTLPAAGTRITSASNSQLFHFTRTTYDITPIFSTGILAHNWRISGALFDTGTNTDYRTTVDPRPFCTGPTTHPDSRYIVFDQIRVQGPSGAPNGRLNRLGCRGGGANMFWDGAYVSITNSDFRNLDFWHPWSGSTTSGPQTGLVPTMVNGSRVTATPGVAQGGAFTTSITGVSTINFTGGSATGTAYVYFAMDGTAQVLAPSGMTGTCTFPGTICSFSTAANPAMPVDANKRVAGLEIFTIALTGGNVSGVSLFYNTTAAGPPYVTEGANAIIGGNGPGPYLFSNNYVAGAGLNLHFDEGGGPFLVRGDYTITNNYFQTESSTQLGAAGSDGLWYGNRQPLEWKGGQRILISGNTFSGCYTQVNPIGTCVVLTPRGGGYTTDLNIINNQFGTYSGSTISPVNGATMVASPLQSHAPVSKPALRQQVSNNLAFVNGWTQTVPGLQPQGWVFYGGEGQEDVTISRNTIYDNRGQFASFLLWLTTPVGGMSITDNVYFYTGGGAMIQNGTLLTSGCTGNPNDKLLMDCIFTSGPGNPSYAFARNIVIPSWRDSSKPGGFVGASAVNSALGSLASQNSIPAGSSEANNLMLVNFTANYTLNPASPYSTSCRGTTVCGYTPPAW